MATTVTIYRLCVNGDMENTLLLRHCGNMESSVREISGNLIPVAFKCAQKKCIIPTQLMPVICQYSLCTVSVSMPSLNYVWWFTGGPMLVFYQLPDSSICSSVLCGHGNHTGEDQKVLQLDYKKYWLVEQGLTSHSIQFRSFRRRCFYTSDDPTNSVKALKEGG